MTGISKKKVGEQIRGEGGRGVGGGEVVVVVVRGGGQLFTALEKPGRKMAISDWCAVPP